MPANAYGSLYSNTIPVNVDCVLSNIRLNNTPLSTLMLSTYIQRAFVTQSVYSVRSIQTVQKCFRSLRVSHRPAGSMPITIL